MQIVLYAVVQADRFIHLNAAMSQIALSHVDWGNRVVLTPDNSGFPGKNMYATASDLARRHKNFSSHE